MIVFFIAGIIESKYFDTVKRVFLFIAAADTFPIVPRVNPLSGREIEVCKRLREFRESTKLSRVAFSREIGIDSALLASYEHGRNPVRYEVARMAGERFGLNQRWLAEGIPPQRPYIIPDSKLDSAIHPRLLFTLAYDAFLKVEITGKIELLDAAGKSGLGLEFFAGESLEDQLKGNSVALINACFSRLPATLYRRFYNELSTFIFDFESKNIVPESAENAAPRLTHRKLPKKTLRGH